MTGFMKLKDELISRTVIMSVVFAVPLMTSWIPPENLTAYLVVAGMAIGGGYVKTVQNMVKKKNGS